LKNLVGARGYKTGIAVITGVLISKWLNLEFPFFVVIASIISMERTIPNSFKAGENRMIGTIIGALAGLAFSLIKPGDAFLCGLGILAVIYLCNLLGRNKAIPIAGIVFSSIMLTLKGRNPWLYSFNRALDTFVGIGIAIAVNTLVLPPKQQGSVNNIAELDSSEPQDD
jgi:uncharacterized membrane protein YgaE (UPF0421/DUF939 family)